MNIRNRRELKTFAFQRLENTAQEKRIVLIYAGLSLGLSALVTIVTYILGGQIDRFGGLRHLGTRKILSSVQMMLPIAQSLFNMCLQVGFFAAMLRIARGQYVSPNTLRLGFDRFWVLLRSAFLKGLIYAGMTFASIYFGILIFMLTPFSEEAVAILTPYLADATMLNSGIILEEAVYAQFAQAVIPAYVICGILLCLLLVPTMYFYRMSNYVIIDRPALGAMAALLESKKMMRRNRIALLKLDVSMWWYYLAVAGASAVGYGDVILSMLGVQLPWSDTVSYFLFYALYLLCLLAVDYFLLNRVEVTYALAYDALKPEEKKEDGVVLGNIFHM